MEDDKKTTGGNQQFLLGLFAGIAVIAVIGVIVLAIVLVTGNRGGSNNLSNNQQNQQAQNQPASGPEAISPTAPGVETFFEKKNAQICKEGGKPVVYLFSTTWCPHCQWVKEYYL